MVVCIGVSIEGTFYQVSSITKYQEVSSSIKYIMIDTVQKVLIYFC